MEAMHILRQPRFLSTRLLNLLTAGVHEIPSTIPSVPSAFHPPYCSIGPVWRAPGSWRSLPDLLPYSCFSQRLKPLKHSQGRPSTLLTRFQMFRVYELIYIVLPFLYFDFPCDTHGGINFEPVGGTSALYKSMLLGWVSI